MASSPHRRPAYSAGHSGGGPRMGPPRGGLHAQIQFPARRPRGCRPRRARDPVGIGRARRAASANVKVSGASPFAGCTADDVAGQPGTNFANSEVEPSVEASSVDRSGDGVPDAIGAYQQDRWSNGGARGIVASVFHGGAWLQRVIPGVSTCSGGSFDRATDPWVATSPERRRVRDDADVPGLPGPTQHVDPS